MVPETLETFEVSILFVDEQLSPLTSASGDVPHAGDQVQWGAVAYEVVAVRRYYAVEQEPLYAARVTVRLLEQE